MSDAYEVIDPRYDMEVETVREFVAWLKAEGWRIVKLNSQGYPEQGLYCVVDEL